ncbi:hypothetical protein K2X96_00850 [Patescibacteria group bacterium]|nr:hypothetical protein [Patescibacteria group bacterium]
MFITLPVTIEEVLTEEGKAPMDTGRTLKQDMLFLFPPSKGDEMTLSELTVEIDHVTHTPGTKTSDPTAEVWIRLEIADFISLHRRDKTWSLFNSRLN